MCTAITFYPADHYFGRNLDLEISYNETVTITPRNFSFHLRNGTVLNTHQAIIGMATIAEDYPLYYDATNESGLSMAGLNFPGNAHYYSFCKGKVNITPFELIPWILCTCATVQEAKLKLRSVNLWDSPFSKQFPLTPLHWLLSDKESSIVIEPLAEGLMLYDDPVGVLTNNPPFPYHMHNLTNYMQLTPQPPINMQPIPLAPYTLGIGSFGLPGDMSSGSRFVRAAFTKLHSICEPTEDQAVSQFLHILGAAAQPRGLTQLENGKFEFTLYSSCCNTDKGIYYYTTYDNSSICAVSLHDENLNDNQLICYPLIRKTQINMQRRS